MIRPIVRLSFVLAFLSLFLVLFAAAPSPVVAQGSGVAQITGTVLDAQRHPVGDAQVRLSGAASSTTTTGGDGSFVFLNLPSGAYRLEISKAGFNAATQDGVVAAAGSTTSLSFTLQSASLTSLTIIGNVSVSTRNGANAINTTPASIVDVPASTFTDQGQLSVNQVLNQEPGITIGLGGNPSASGSCNGASPLASGVPSIRGGLPYETESLIDGHAISLGQQGFFSPSFISPYLLQNVEVVKGPGSTSPSINYAINGTVNYRTLEPTLKPQESVDFGEDQYGGNFANFRATGTLPGGRFSYAFDYVTQGTQAIGSYRGFSGPATFYSAAGGANALFNGVPFNPDIYNVGPGASNVLNSYSYLYPFFICCPTVPTDFNQRNELGKIRYAFTPSTTLTVTWLGGQTAGSYYGARGYPCPNYFFTPPAGYTGSLPGGYEPASWFPQYGNGLTTEDVNLFETEFHTPLGKTATLLLRQYTSSIQNFQGGGPGDSGPSPAGMSVTGAVYGGIFFCSNPSCSTTTEQLFSGQVATMTALGQCQYFETRSYNDLNGYTAEIDKQAGDDLLSLSYDEERTSTLATQDLCTGTNSIVIPGGSSQTFQSVMGRVQFELGQRVDGTVSDNFGSYTDIYSQDGGVSFLSSTHTYQAPRLSLTWRPNSGASVRASVGTSIAPPYLNLLNNDALVFPGDQPATYFTETGNSGDVLPETAVGYDLGLDTRLHSPFTVLSVDVYQTILHNQFLNSTSIQGTFTCTTTDNCITGGFPFAGSGPLYVTKTANLGHSEYEGVELSLHRSPPTGWGYRVQGSLMRAFAYDLPAGFYDTATCTNCANLAVLPNINFQTSGGGYNGMSASRVPYSMGYGEINYRGRNGSYFLAGITYYGPNNSYDDPAFGVVTVSYNQPLTRHTSLQLSIYNLTNAYPQPYYQIDYNGNGSAPIYTPLENGQLGSVNANVIGPATARLMLHVDL